MEINNRTAGSAMARCGIVTVTLAALCIDCGHFRPGNDIQRINRLPTLSPYTYGTIIPPDIAPLNFIIKENGERFFVSISKNGESGIEIASPAPAITIPPGKWRELLRTAKSFPIGITVYCYANKTWRRYETMWDTVGGDSIDRYIVYRKIPVCKDWNYMGLYERDIQDFKERMVFHNRNNGVCFHCHSFRNNDANDMVLEFRSKTVGTPMLLGTMRNGKNSLRAVNTKTAFSTGKVGFTSWHPTSDILAFSMNRFEMLFNSAGKEPREVFDAEGDVALFDFDLNKVIASPYLSQKDRIETMPEWSKDGRFLYFCSAPQLPEKQYREVQCDLMRIAFDPVTRQWGLLDTVLTAQKAGGSILQPKCSPDGLSLLVSIAAYSDFPIDKVGSRLGLIDIKTSALRILYFGRRWKDGWHSWSSNGHWIVFNSKRMNGRFSSLWFSYRDSAGVVHSPFVLPQRDPSFYESSIIAYNIPEFITSRINITFSQFQKAISDYRKNAMADAASADSAHNGEEREY